MARPDGSLITRLRAIPALALLLSGVADANGLSEVPDTAAANELLVQLHRTNRQEIMIAELALERSRSTKVRALADRALRDHAFTERKVQAIARSTDLELPASAGSPPDLVPRELRLATGSRFDELFLRWMREGHRAALESMRRLVASVEPGSEVGLLAARLVPILEQHRSLADRVRPDSGKEG